MRYSVFDAKSASCRSAYLKLVDLVAGRKGTTAGRKLSSKWEKVRFIPSTVEVREGGQQYCTGLLRKKC